MQSPGGFDGKGEQQEMLPQVQQPAVGELDVNLPAIDLGELEASPTIMEIGEPKSPVHEETRIREVEARADQDSRTAAPGRIADENSAAGEHDKTEDEEREIGESIRTGDDKRIWVDWVECDTPHDSDVSPASSFDFCHYIPVTRVSRAYSNILLS